MASYNSIVITTAGTQMINSTISNGAKITFTRVQTSQTQYSQAQLPSLTSLSPIAQETINLIITSASATQTKISITFTNTTVMTTYNANTVALFASDGTNEVLFAIATAKIAESVPAFDGNQAQSMVIDFYLALNAENATVDVNNAGMATVSALVDVENQLINQINTIDKNAVHLAGDETIIGVKTFTQKINGTTTSADKLSTARKIGGVAFDGTTDINLPGVNVGGNQDTTGLARGIKATSISSGSDLNNFRIPGNFWYFNSQGLTNAPTGYKSFQLEVNSSNGGTTGTQRMTLFDTGLVYVRGWSLTGGNYVWTSWQMQTSAILLSNMNTDINSIYPDQYIEQTYLLDSVGTGSLPPLVNSPLFGTLKVTRSNATTINQTLYTNDNGVYYRAGNGSTWNSWYSLVKPGSMSVNDTATNSWDLNFTFGGGGQMVYSLKGVKPVNCPSDFEGWGSLTVTDINDTTHTQLLITSNGKMFYRGSGNNPMTWSSWRSV